MVITLYYAITATPPFSQFFLIALRMGDIVTVRIRSRKIQF